VKLDWREGADPDTPTDTVFDNGNGLALTANCAGTSVSPTMAILANGNQDDGIFQGTLFNGATSTIIGPSDGDLDNGDSQNLVTSGPGNELNGLLINYAGRDDSATSVDALARTKSSPAEPTQGNCSFVGTAVISD